MEKIWSKKYQEFGARCVYCGKNLFADLDAYMGAVHDHIIPLKSEGPDNDENKALSCAVCNNLKGDFDPRTKAGGLSKEQLLEAARDRVFFRRSEKMKEFFVYLKQHESR